MDRLRLLVRRDHGFNVLLTFYVVCDYLDELCEYLFRTRGVGIQIFVGRFRRKIGIAILYVAFAGMTLLPPTS